MADDKVPNGIDIFVFSNGEHSSPPRKYHLKAEELQWWSVTVKYLATAHYGLLNSIIDLYTVDGKKIEDSFELINETAYVAVRPPEPFIEGGYDEYLLKASRSWERRQSQRTTVPVVNRVNVRDTNEKHNAVSQHIIPENNEALYTIKPSNSIENTGSVFVQPSGNEKRYMKSTNEKKNSVQYPTSTRNSRAEPSTATTASRKSIVKKKENVKLDNGKITRTPNKRLNSVTSDETKKIAIKNKILKTHIGGKGKDSIQDAVILKFDEVVTELRNFSSKKNLNQEVLPESNIENTKLSNEIPPCKNNEIPNLYMNSKLEALSTLGNVKLIQEEMEKINATSIYKREEEPQFNTNGAELLNVKLDNVMSQPTNKKDSNNVNHFPKMNIDFNSEHSPTDKVSNKEEEYVNLKFNIEICNHSNSYYKHKVYSNHPQCNIPKEEKSSQVNIPDESIQANRSLHTYITENEINEAKKDNTVIVVKCSPHHINEQSYGNYEKPATKSDKRDYIIFLPIVQVGHGTEGCHCKLHEMEQTMRHRTIVNSVKKVTSCLSLLPTYNHSEYKVSENTTHAQSKMKINDTKVKNAEKPIKREIKPTVNKESQTEWHNILMEARRKDDDHYSFHLPSLDLLKKYNKVYFN